MFFLTKKFGEGSDLWMSLEWSTAWRYYTEDRNRKVICVNYDQLRRKDGRNGIVKALLVCGPCIDFCRSSNFIESCIEMVGPPMAMALRP